MDKRYIDENDIGRKYLNNQLSVDDTEAFEIYLIDNPDMVEQLELDQIMSEGLQEQDVHAESKAKGLLERLIGLISKPIPVYAPVLAAFALVPFLYMGQTTGTSNSELTMINYSTETVRGSEPIEANSMAAALIEPRSISGAGALLIKLQPRTVKTHPEFIATLSDRGTSQLLWESPRFRPTPLRDKLILLPTNLSVSNVQLEVFAISEDGKHVPVDFCHYTEVCSDPIRN